MFHQSHHVMLRMCYHIDFERSDDEDIYGLSGDQDSMQQAEEDIYGRLMNYVKSPVISQRVSCYNSVVEQDLHCHDYKFAAILLIQNDHLIVRKFCYF